MIKLIRYRKTDECVQGLLTVDDLPACSTIERPDLDNKRGVSCIPVGSYELGIQENITPLTKHYRKRFPELFMHHLHIKNVPGRDNIYIHVGNYPTDVNGCIAIGVNPTYDMVTNSVDTFKRVYPQLLTKVPCQIQIIEI